MEAINDWLDSFLSNLARKLERKYKIEKNINKAQTKLENNLHWVKAFGWGIVAFWVILFFWICS
jgi:hypothetical protein